MTDLISYLRRQCDWSERTFGPGPRPAQVVAHIRKELTEIEAKPDDVMEWIDVAMLAFDGAFRGGHSPEQIAEALQRKLQVNEERRWPDWRTVPIDQPIEHVR